MGKEFTKTIVDDPAVRTDDFSHAEIARFRNQTEGCLNVIHFNNAGASLMPDVVKQSVVDHIGLESRVGGYEASALRADVIQTFYERAGHLLNTKPHNIAFTASATDSYTRALASIPFEPGDTILTDRDGYISNQIQFLSLAKRLGTKIVRIRNSSHGGVDLQDLERQLWSLKPRLLSITHIPTNSGLVQPVDDIAEVYTKYIRAHADRTWYLLDACQSLGQMKLNVKQLTCDFLSVTGRKFLRGPRGTGFLYVADRVLEGGLEPMFIDMRGAEWVGPDQYEPRETAMRFEDWEFAYALLLGTSEAISYCLAIGEDRIWLRVKSLAQVVRNELSRFDRIRVLDKGPELGGLVTFTVKGTDPHDILDTLEKAKINVVPSYRAFAVIDFDDKGVQWAIRVSPHYFNTIDEIDEFLRVMKTVV